MEGKGEEYPEGCLGCGFSLLKAALGTLDNGIWPLDRGFGVAQEKNNLSRYLAPPPGQPVIRVPDTIPLPSPERNLN